jgi:ubiquinol-cytochrome c reductase cytochrome c subunit
MSRLVASVILAFVPFAALAQTSGGDAVRGKALFLEQGCYACHGTVGHGEPYGPRLAPHALPREAFAHQVRHPRGSMPRYAPQFLTDAQLADLYAYVASIPEGRKASEIGLLR